jgi:hypothetical protein
VFYSGPGPLILGYEQDFNHVTKITHNREEAKDKRLKKLRRKDRQKERMETETEKIQKRKK